MRRLQAVLMAGTIYLCSACTRVPQVNDCQVTSIMNADKISFMPQGEVNYSSFSDLPAIAKKGTSLLARRLSELDLSRTNSLLPFTETAKNIHTYIQQHADTSVHPLFPPWANSTPKFSDHKISIANPHAKACAELKNAIQECIGDIVTGVDYNGLQIVTQFITFCEKQRKLDPNISNIEIFHLFEPDSKDEASLTYGTACVGKALHIVKVLAEKKIEAHVVIQHVVIPAKGINEPAGHAAVVVPGKDGVLLIEIEQKVPILILEPNKHIEEFFPGKGTREEPQSPAAENPALHVFMELIEVPGSCSSSTPIIVKKEIFITETKRKKNIYSEYILRPNTNPDQSVMKKWLVSKHILFYPVTSAAREGQPQHSIQLNIAEDKMTFSIGNKKFRIPLEAFDPATKSIDRTKLVGDQGQVLSEDQKDFILGKKGDHSLGGEFFDAFKTSKKLLLDQIFTVVANRQMLNDLRK